MINKLYFTRRNKNLFVKLALIFSFFFVVTGRAFSEEKAVKIPKAENPNLMLQSKAKGERLYDFQKFLEMDNPQEAAKELRLHLQKHGISLTAKEPSQVIAAMEEAVNEGVKKKRQLIHVFNGTEFYPAPGRETALSNQASKLATDKLNNKGLICILQFQDDFTAENLIELLEAGVKVYEPAGDRAFIVRFPVSAYAFIQSRPYIRWLGEYKAEYKYSSVLSNSKRKGAFVYPLGGDRPEYRADLQRLGIPIRLYDSSANLYAVILDESKFKETAEKLWWVKGICKEPEEQSLGSTVPTAMRGVTVNFEPDDSREIIMAYDASTSGSGVLVGVRDDGIYYTHTELANIFDSDSDFGPIRLHGTHVTGIVAGRQKSITDPWGSSVIKGVAYSANVLFRSHELLSYPFDFNSFKTRGALISNHSYAFQNNNYTSETDDFDTYCDNEDMVLVVAAGNNGASVENPGIAKNVVTAGAIYYVSVGSSTIGAKTWYSSPGPTAYGGSRLKPELIAPGGDDEFKSGGVCSTNSNPWSMSGYSGSINNNYEEPEWESDDNYLLDSGTSMAVPHVTGICAKIKGYYGSNIHSELIKALLINTAIPIKASSSEPLNGYANTGVGYGLANGFSPTHFYEGESQRLLFAEDWLDEDDTVNYDNWSITVPSNTKALCVTMAYNDQEGLHSSNDALKDDLDLILIPPSGSWYYAYQHLPSQVTSQSPLEKIIITNPAPAPGTWTVRVRFTDSPGFGNPLIFAEQRYGVVAEAILKVPALSLSVQESTVNVTPGQSIAIHPTVTNTGGYIAAGVTLKVTQASGSGFGGDINKSRYVGNLMYQNDSASPIFNLTAPSTNGTYTLTVEADGINREFSSGYPKTAQVTVVVSTNPPLNHPPNNPNNVSPANAATGVSKTPTLQSSAFSDPDSGDTHQASRWEIRLASGSYADPVWNSGADPVNKTSVSVPVGTLSYNTTYYWHVKHQDNHGEWSNWSSETSFTTMLEPNNPPNIPNTPTGPTTGYINTSYTFTSSATDSDVDQVRLKFYWGNDTEGFSWSDYVASGTQVNINHAFTTYGNHDVKVLAEDEHGLSSGWSSILGVNILIPDFEFNPAVQPSVQTITQGQSADYAVSLKSLGGYNQPVTLSVTGLSPWPGNNTTTWNFSPNPLTPGDPSTNATLHLTTSSNIIPGTYTVSIKGTDGSKTKYASVQLIVNPSSDNGSVSGVTYVEETSSPLSGVVVQSKEQFGSWQDRGSATSASGTGNYKIDGLVPGKYSVYATLAGYGLALKTGVQVDAGQETQNQHLYLTNNPGRISGTVKNTNNDALTGVRVEICPTAGYATFWINKYVDSNASGYEITGLSAGNNYLLRANGTTINGTDYARWEKRNVSIQKGTATQENIVMQQAAKIIGSVKDSSGNNIKDTRVVCSRIYGTSTNYETEDTTTENGNYRDYNLKYLPSENSYSVIVEPPSGSSYAISAQTINIPAEGAGQTHTLNFVLQGGAIQISGKVTDKNSNALKNVRVTYWNGSQRIWKESYTNENGDYIFTNLPKGWAELRVENPPAGFAGEGIEQDFNANTEHNFALGPEARLSGVIKDADTKQPITELLEVDYGSDKRNYWSQTWTSNGNFAFTNLPEGIAHIRVRPEVNPAGEGYPWREKYVYLAEGENKTGFEIFLKKSALVTINAKDSANPTQGIPSARLYTLSSGGDQYEWYGGTDFNGSKQIRLAPGLLHRIYFENEEDDSWVGLPGELAINSPTDDKVVNLTGYNSSAASFISGNLSSSATKHANSCFEICAFPAGEVYNRNTIKYLSPIRFASFEPTQTSGSYSLTLPPNSSYDLCLVLTYEDEDDLWSTTVVSGLVPNVATGAAGTTNPKHDFSFTSEGAEITGKVTYCGQPVLVADVYLEDLNGQIVALGETDNNGVYHFYNVPAGDYKISAWHTEYGESQLLNVSGLTDGATKSGVDIEFGSLPPFVTADINGDGKDELIVDFGDTYGIWIRYADGSWSQLHNLSPKFMVNAYNLDQDAGNKDDLIIDFGSAYGIWIYYNNSTWQQLHNLSSKSILAANIDGDVDPKEDIVIDFGEPYGIWVYYNSSTWNQLHNLSADSIIADNLDQDAGNKNDLIIDFGSAYGIWIYYNNSSWTQLHNLSPKSMLSDNIDADSKKDLVIDFGEPYGIWAYYNNSTWGQLHNLSSESITTADLNNSNIYDLVIDFGPAYGIWIRFDDGSWSQLHNLSPESIISGNLDTDPKDDLVIDFGDSYGIWGYFNNSTWSQIHNLSP